MPPELLGQVFRWNVILGAFDGLRKDSYNFLLVCHHWFEIASNTPELWTFWGNNLKQWTQRYRRSGTAPFDIILYPSYFVRGGNATFDEPLRDTLRDRATRNYIRPAHLHGWDADPLHSLISTTSSYELHT